MIRANAFAAVGGYRDGLIAGEDPELSVRLRAAGWRIWRLDREMVLHDADMTHFRQWWRRALRAGYAYAQNAHLHGASSGHPFVWETRRAWLFGIWLPIVCVFSVLLFGFWGLALWLIYPFEIFRKTTRNRNRGALRDRALLDLFLVLSRFAEGMGQIRYLRDRLFGRQSRLIEYR
jgi:GT2 family glycosyltransferase